MNIRELARHIEEQISHKDAREPNAQWVLNELKLYLEDKDADSLIDNAMFDQELKKLSKCQWCDMPLEPEGNLIAVIEGCGRFKVCWQCLSEYANNQYGNIMSRIKQVKG